MEQRRRNCHTVLKNLFEKKIREHPLTISVTAHGIHAVNNDAVFWSELKYEQWGLIANLAATKFIDVNLVDSRHSTALRTAVLFSEMKPEMVQLVAILIESGADVNLRPSKTALEIALTPKLYGSRDKEGRRFAYVDYQRLAPAALLLLAAGADPFDCRIRDKRSYQQVVVWLETLRYVRAKCGQHTFIGDTVAEFLYNEKMLLKAISGVELKDLVNGKEIVSSRYTVTL